MSLIVKSLNYIHPDNHELFNDLNFNFNDGEKAALVGVNGAGKSTLLRLIAGNIRPTSGAITYSEKPWYVPQHLGEYDTWTIAKAMNADVKLKALHAILGGHTTERNFADLNDDWDIENKMLIALEKWGMGSFKYERVLSTLSGGQKTKLFLAALDMNKPGLILLDEPSNHLDKATRSKLYDMIQHSKATMLIVSHDKVLLDLMNKTMELSPKGIEVFGGNFEFYQQQKANKVHALEARLNEQTRALKQSERKASDMASLRASQESKGRSTGMSHSIPRIIAGGLKGKAERSTARLLNAHSEKINGLSDSIRETRSQIQEYEPLKLNIANPDLTPGKVLMDVADIKFSYDGIPLWTDLSFKIKSGERIQIEGDNGAGKTTLLKILTHEITALAGSYKSLPFSFIYLDQDYSMINPEWTVYEQLQEYNKMHLEEHALKSLLIHAQFDKDAFDKKCSALSGGEKMKLSLCCLTAGNRAPDVLILDEPTNNLDVQSLDVLTLAVKAYKGTLLVISHDTYFINEVGITRTINLT